MACGGVPAVPACPAPPPGASAHRPTFSRACASPAPGAPGSPLAHHAAPTHGPRATLTSPCCPAGARWDTQTGVIADARLKELTPAMPVIFIRAIPADRMETKNIYECPVYKTRIRGPTYVWTFNLKTKEKAAKWILAAVALLLQV